MAVGDLAFYCTLYLWKICKLGLGKIFWWCAATLRVYMWTNVSILLLHNMFFVCLFPRIHLLLVDLIHQKLKQRKAKLLLRRFQQYWNLIQAGEAQVEVRGYTSFHLTESVKICGLWDGRMHAALTQRLCFLHLIWCQCEALTKHNWKLPPVPFLRIGYIFCWLDEVISIWGAFDMIGAMVTP